MPWCGSYRVRGHAPHKPRCLRLALKIVTHARVTHINTDKDGRVTGVLYPKGRQLYFQPAKLVLLAGYVFENTRLFLLSKSKAYPRRSSREGLFAAVATSAASSDGGPRPDKALLGAT